MLPKTQTRYPTKNPNTDSNIATIEGIPDGAINWN